MNRSNKDIFKYIKSGQYFVDARMWYARKYLYPIIERSSLTIALFFLGFLVIIILFNFREVVMNKFEENFIVSIDDSTLEYAKIKKISPNNHETYKKFVEYMLALYVNKIENYAYRDITNNAKFIYNHSSKQLFRHYYNKRKISNPDSPVLIYGKSAKRNIEIERIDYKLGTNNAIIYFKSNIESNIDGSPNYVNHAKWAAEIQFDLPNFKQMMGQKLSAEKGKSKENNNKLNFIVIEYKATKLN